jgi:hypothetical protein
MQSLPKTFSAHHAPPLVADLAKVMELYQNDLSDAAFNLVCKRRSNNPSLNRPGFRSRRSKNPAADSLFALSRQRAGDEERGRLFEGAACGSH